jgi:hypothetical protein
LKEHFLYEQDEEDYEEDEEDEEEKVQPTFRFEACSSGQMYDPFSKKCIPVPSICRVGSSLVYGRCVPDDERYDDDDVTKVFARSAADELKHNDDDDDDDDEIDDAVVTTLRPDLQQSSRLPVVVECPLGGGLQSINETDYVRHPNGSVYVVSLRRLFDAELCHYGSIVNDDNNSKGSNKLPMYVCIDKPLTGSPSVTTASATATRQVPAPQPFRLPMFKFGSLERLASIIGTLIGAVAYLTVLLASCIFRHRGPGGCGSSSDTAARCVVCLMICLFVRHVCYLAIVTGDSLQLCLNSVIDPSPVASPTRKVCFYASAGLQYASLAAFFWLNVLTVEVYRRLSAKLAISPVHPSIDFIFYSLYAWTLPALVVGWSIAVEILGVDAWAPSFISEGTAEENAPQSSTDSAFSSLKRHSSECWVLGFIQLLLFVIPAALLTIVDIVLFVVAGCRKCLRNGSDDDDDDDEETDKSPTRKKLAAADEHLPHPWRRNAPDKQRNADYDEDAYDTDGGSTLTLRRAENLYVCSVQLTMLMSMTWTLCFMASTLPGAPHPLLWYLYVIFDVALALTASFAFLTTEYQIWRRMATRRSQWDLLLAADSPAHRLQRRATGPGDVIVVEGMTGWPTSTSQAVQSTDTSEPNLPLTAAATTSCEPADTATDRKDDDSLRLLMRETSI